MMNFTEFFGFDHEIPSVNVCFVFFEKLLSEVMAAGWINKKQKNRKNNIFC